MFGTAQQRSGWSSAWWHFSQQGGRMVCWHLSWSAGRLRSNAGHHQIVL